MINNIASDQIIEAKNLFETAKDILILTPKNPTFDCVAGALSFYLSTASRGKQVTIVCPTPMTVEFNQLVGVDKITDQINVQQGKNLVISFPYQEGSIEKVSYNIENNSFNLVIEPRESCPVITSEKIRYSFSGGHTDLICTVGVEKLSDLDNIYLQYQGIFSDKPLINIDIKPSNQRFGKVNIIEQNISSVSELITSLFSVFGFTIDSDISTNLLAGIASGSENYTSALTSVTTFETAAICLKNGARKIASVSPKVQPTFKQPVNIPIQPSTSPQVNFQPIQNLPNFTKSSSFKPYSPKPKLSTIPVQQQQPVMVQSQPNISKKPVNQAPPDWLKPKIYKGSTLL